ncbi:MAG: UUP1 family membrane protein, partial [Deltaproteobacteria bacterium]|nr:UUP1 family membrane protein [Deltaproteobacteria bacterium]
MVFQFPLLPETKARVWQVETKITFMAKDEPVRASLFLPLNSESYKVFNEAFISRGYGLNTPTNEVNRRAVWNLRDAHGKQTIYYRAAIRRLETKPAITEPTPLEKPDFTGADLIAAEWLVDFIHKKSTDNCSMAARLIQRLNQPATNDNLTLLLGKHPGESGKVALAVKILALAGVPAREVNGIRLSEHSDKAELVHWLEVYDGKQWRSHDPVTGLPRLAENYLAWWRGPAPLAQVTGGTKLEVEIYTSSNPEAALQAAIAQIGYAKPLLLKFSLFNLPLHTQAVYRVLLLIPVGVFVLVLLRNIVGLAMFGTFMPVLIALAFRETQLLWGIVLFSMLVGLG